MTIKHLHYFIAVAEEKSFTNAARKYYIAQTAMSQQISALEKELGFRLFHRTNRTVELTRAGAVLYKKLQPLVLQLEEAVKTASSMAGVQNRSFRIGMSDQAVNRFLTGTLSLFRELEPDVTPVLVQDDHVQLQEVLTAGGLDVMVLGKRFYTPRSYLAATELFSYQVLEYTLAVPSDSTLAKQDVLDWSDLQGLKLIAYSPLREDQEGASTRALLKEHGVEAEIYCSTRAVKTAILYVESGFGCSLLPAHAADHANDRVRMVPVRSDLRDTMLLLHHKDSDNPLVRTFLSLCRQEMHGT